MTAPAVCPTWTDALVLKLLLAVLLAGVGCDAFGPRNRRECWNEREGESFWSAGRVTATCCQDKVRRYDFYLPAGPVVCTPGKNGAGTMIVCPTCHSDNPDIAARKEAAKWRR